jgi:hypothetical protein
MVVVVEPLRISITGSTEIVGGGISGVKALNASEIESHKPGTTVSALHTTGFHDVVQCEDFGEIQSTDPVTVQATEKVIGINPVVVTALLDEVQELIKANSAILIRIHRAEEVRY